MTAEILVNVIGYLAAIADMGNRIENDCSKMNKQMIEEFSDYSKMNKQMIAEVGEVKQKVMMHQGAIEVLTTKPERGQAGSARGILENKSVTSLPMLGTDKNSFRNWNDRMINVVVNVRPGTRKYSRP